jgi:hypothetical protein
MTDVCGADQRRRQMATIRPRLETLFCVIPGKGRMIGLGSLALLDETADADYVVAIVLRTAQDVHAALLVGNYVSVSKRGHSNLSHLPYGLHNQ